MQNRVLYCKKKFQYEEDEYKVPLTPQSDTTDEVWQDNMGKVLASEELTTLYVRAYTVLGIGSFFAAVPVCAVNVGVSTASASDVASEPVATSVPSSATAPLAVPVITGASSSPVTVTVTV